MTTRKNYNSIVFLTTLSVYLGLVLVGAPAPVLAQQSHKDKKIQNVVSNDIYGTALLELVRQLEKLSKEGKYNQNEPINLDYQFRYFEKGKAETAFICAGVKPNENVLKILDETAKNISRYLSELESVSSKRDEVFISPFAVSYSIDQSGLMIKTSRSDKENVGFFRIHFEQEAVALKDESVAQIYENTKATSENNQVLIVTRLPRGSLDALIAKDAQ